MTKTKNTHPLSTTDTPPTSHIQINTHTTPLTTNQTNTMTTVNRQPTVHNHTRAPPVLLTDRTVCHYTSSFLLKCTAQFTSPLPCGVIMRNDMLMVHWYTADACAISNHSLSVEVKYLQVSSLKAPKLISRLKLKKTLERPVIRCLRLQ